jgi:hypothetical protein
LRTSVVLVLTNLKIFIEAVNNMKNEKAPSQFQRMKDAYLERKNNPERRLPEDMSDEEHLRYMNNSRGIKKDDVEGTSQTF